MRKILTYAYKLYVSMRVYVRVYVSVYVSMIMCAAVSLYVNIQFANLKIPALEYSKTRTNIHTE